jgi:curved DNA-binding protein CbpA
MCDCGNGETDREKLNLPATGILTEEDIKKAYRKCALKCHPDKYRTEDASRKFQIIGNAYANLMKPPSPPRWAPPRWSPPRRSPPKQKAARCPKGTRRNKTTGLCEDSNQRKSPPPPRPQGQYPQPGKRCPNGTHKSRTTGLCLPNKPKRNYYAPPSPPSPPSRSPSPRSPPTPKKGKRCPNGTRKNKRTGLCEPK